MNLTDEEIASAARELNEAEKTHARIGLLSVRWPTMTLDDAYAVQSAWVSLKTAAGSKPIGWKIGLTSKAMQSALNIDMPDSGVLFDDMLFEDGATIGKDRFIEPRIEAEVAFIMRTGLAGPSIQITDVLNATDYVLPALEILDTRILRRDPSTGVGRSVIDTISDNAANAGIVIGGRPTRPDQIDLRWAGAIVTRNAQVEETGLGAGVLNHPAQGVAWLARRLARYGGQIEAGQVVLSGSFIRPIETKHGDTISADFGPLGSISVHFE